MENKPDFEQSSKEFVFTRDLGIDEQETAFLSYVAGCEHVWNTHVVPLQEKAKYWEQQYADLGKTAADHLEYANKKRLQNETLESENKALREEIERLNINQPPFR